MSQLSHVNAIPKVKIIVVGDSGVGKTSCVHLITHEEPLVKSSWTIGCGVEVKLHEYCEGTSSQKSHFIEFWDVGGNNSHKNARYIFFNSVNGIILVHDLTNRKSQKNLHSWLAEVLLRDGDGLSSRMPLVDGFDAEQFGGFSQLPVLVVGTKSDQVSSYAASSLRLTTSPIATQCGADEIFVNCLDVRSISPGSSNAVKLSRFFDRVISHQLRGGSARPEDGGFGEREGAAAVRRSKATHINIPS